MILDEMRLLYLQMCDCDLCIARLDTCEWLEVLETLLQNNKEACFWLVDFLGCPKGQSYIGYARKDLETLGTEDNNISKNVIWSYN